MNVFDISTHQLLPFPSKVDPAPISENDDREQLSPGIGHLPLERDRWVVRDADLGVPTMLEDTQWTLYRFGNGGKSMLQVMLM